MRHSILLTVLVLSSNAGFVSGQTSPYSTLPLTDLSSFRDPPPNWQIVGDYSADRDERHAFVTAEGTGILANIQTEEARGNLFTTWEHADLELDLEVLMPAGSNSGLYFQSRYEIQLFDSWGVDPPRHSDIGGIYQRWDESRPDGEKGYEGHPPRINVARAPGLWQHLNVLFQAPRFDGNGKKVENARFLRVTLNGVILHENVELFGPTRAAAFEDEVAEAPLMIQGDHGPVAFRNIKYRLYDTASVELSDLTLSYYRGLFGNQMPDLASLNKVKGEPVDVITSLHADTVKLFVLQYTGTLSVPKTGAYMFEVAHTSRVRLEIDGEEVLTDESERVSSIREFPRNAGQISLTRGDHTFTLTYAKGRWHNVPTALGWFVTGPGLIRNELTAPGSLPYDAYSAFEITPGNGAHLQRSFVMHNGKKRTHAISVGYPEGINYSYDLSRGAMLHLWKGPFVDASTMWYERGVLQSALPLGSVIERSGKPTLAILENDSAPWPDSLDNFSFERYRLDEEGETVYTYQVGPLTVTDHIAPDSARRTLFRTLQIQGDADNAWLLLVESNSIERLNDTTFIIDDQTMYIEVEDVSSLSIREDGDAYQLVMPLRPSSESSTLTYRLTW